MSNTTPTPTPTPTPETRPTRGGRGGGRGGGGNKTNDDRTISKSLSYTLRHGAEKEKLKLRSDGYANAAELLAMPKFRKLGLTFERLRRIVKENDKQRYTLVLASSVKAPPAAEGAVDPATGVTISGVHNDSSKGKTAVAAAVSAEAEPTDADPAHYLIRATQGHSIALSSASLSLTPLDAHALPVAVHGTFYGPYEAIVASGHLSRMGRNHIHLAAAETGVVSGMRRDAEVLVYVDVLRAVEEGGLSFWTSANGVVLTEGDAEGRLDLGFVSRIVERVGGRVLWEGGRVVGELPEGVKGRGGGGGRGGKGRGGRGRGRGGRGGRGRGGGNVVVPEERVDAGDP